MSISKRWKWSGIVGVALTMTVTVLFARPQSSVRKECLNYLTLDQALKVPSKPCDCPDRAAIEKAIQDKIAEEQEIQAIVNNGSNQDVNEQLAQQTNQELIIGKSPMINGKCTPMVCEDTIKSRCTQLWRASFAHEQGHCDFGDGLSLFALIYGRYFSQSKWNQLVAEGEIAARQAEVAYLQEQLRELEKKCPKIARYPGLDDSGSDKIRLAEASGRVSGYAATM